MDAGLGGWIGTIIIGGLAGWVASMIMKTDQSMGVFMNIIVGVIGAIVANFLLSLFGFGGTTDNSGLITKFVVALIGAIIVLFIARLFMGRRTPTAQ
jgi:uncharacterized membrane protein YeaQ/YmgE (transglycosylase-associated protein family)